MSGRRSATRKGTTAYHDCFSRLADCVSSLVVKVDVRNLRIASSKRALRGDLDQPGIQRTMNIDPKSPTIIDRVLSKLPDASRFVCGFKHANAGRTSDEAPPVRIFNISRIAAWLLSQRTCIDQRPVLSKIPKLTLEPFNLCKVVAKLIQRERHHNLVGNVGPSPGIDDGTSHVIETPSSVSKAVAQLPYAIDLFAPSLVPKSC